MSVLELALGLILAIGLGIEFWVFWRISRFMRSPSERRTEPKPNRKHVARVMRKYGRL